MINEITNTLEGVKCRLEDAEELMSNLEDTVMERFISTLCSKKNRNQKGKIKSISGE